MIPGTSWRAARLALVAALTVACEHAATTPRVAGEPAAAEKSGGDGQFAQVGAAARAPLEVTVTDAFGDPVAGVAVAWSVTSGNATVSGLGPTDAAGRAQATLVASSPAPRTITATATVAGLPALVFTASAVRVVLDTAVAIPANYGIHDQFFRDGLLFVSAWNTGLRIYDVGKGVAGGTPAAPALVSTIVTSANGVAGGAQVHNAWWYWSPGGQKKYVFVGQEGPGSIGSSSSGDIHVVDVSTLASPVEVGFYHMAPVAGQPAGTHNFWVDEAAEILYAAYYNGGVVALDVSGSLGGDLTSREIARIRPGGASTFVWGVQLHNGSVYATDMLSGFWQLRLVDSTFTIVGGGNNVPERFGSDQWVHGSVAYSGTWGSRAGHAGNAVKVWRLGATGAPALADSIIVPNVVTISDLEVSDDGQVLMLSTEGGSANGLYFYSLAADALRPRFMAFHAVPSGVHTTTFGTVAGRRYAFAAKDPANPALLILDVTDLWP